MLLNLGPRLRQSSVQSGVRWNSAGLLDSRLDSSCWRRESHVWPNDTATSLLNDAYDDHDHDYDTSTRHGTISDTLLHPKIKIRLAAAQE